MSFILETSIVLFHKNHTNYLQKLDSFFKSLSFLCTACNKTQTSWPKILFLSKKSKIFTKCENKNCGENSYMCGNTNVCCQGDSPPGLHCTCGCNLGPSNPLPENISAPEEDPFFKELASQVKRDLV